MNPCSASRRSRGAPEDPTSRIAAPFFYAERMKELEDAVRLPMNHQWISSSSWILAWYALLHLDKAQEYRIAVPVGRRAISAKVENNLTGGSCQHDAGGMQAVAGKVHAGEI